MTTIIIKKTESEMTTRLYESYVDYCKIIKKGRENPISFIEHFMGIYFMDFQKYIFMNSWHRPYVIWLASRNAGKSFLAAPLIMAKSVLFPSFETYILAGSADQSRVLYNKIREVAKKQLVSAPNATNFFIEELLKSNNTTDGFTKEGTMHLHRFPHGSVVRSVSGNYNLLRGKRANLNVYDEFGFGSKEMFTTTEPFLTQDSSFQMAKDTIDTDGISPLNIPNQRLIASSASSIDTHLYTLYKEYAKKMMWGHPDYFVVDISCEIPLRPTLKGKEVNPLLTQETIDSAIKRDPEEGAREYYNKFTKDGGLKQPIKRSMIMKNSMLILPEFNNIDNNSKYVFAYDPARTHDNSICSVGKLIYDKNLGYKMRIVNCVSFADANKKKHTPMRTPDQVDAIKKMFLNYNGTEKGDYENIEAFLIDSGSGGAGRTIGDSFNENWQDDKGVLHYGLCDSEEQFEQLYNFPTAIDKMKLISPTKMKVAMVDALIQMLELGVMEFPMPYDGKEFYTLEDEEGESEVIQLTQEDKDALVQIDLMKKECYSIYRFTGSNSNYRYDLPPEKKDKDFDDRFFTLIMLAWYLQEKRRENILKPKQIGTDDLDVWAAYSDLFS